MALRSCVYLTFFVACRGRRGSKQFSGWANHYRTRDQRANPNIGRTRARPAAAAAADPRTCDPVIPLNLRHCCLTVSNVLTLHKGKSNLQASGEGITRTGMNSRQVFKVNGGSTSLVSDALY